MRRTTMLLIGGLIGGYLVLPIAVSAGEEEPEKTKIRIGTYDSRAIAIAYAASQFNPVAEKMVAYEKAKAEGDQAKVKELEAWGQQHQRQLHFQGFGRVPVGDLLEPVKEQVARIARDQQLAAVAMNCDFAGQQVELVDITEDLVKLYNPTEKTWKHVREIRKFKPVSLIELADLPAKH